MEYTPYIVQQDENSRTNWETHNAEKGATEGSIMPRRGSGKWKWCSKNIWDNISKDMRVRDGSIACIHTTKIEAIKIRLINIVNVITYHLFLFMSYTQNEFFTLSRLSLSLLSPYKCNIELHNNMIGIHVFAIER